jgi:hypothetical protein
MITLKRVSSTGEATFGVLVDNETPFALTLERPWTKNRPGVSCIPRGWYRCRRVRSPRFGEAFEVQDVPGRSGILFHAGNTPSDTRGCILVGSRFGKLNGLPAVLASRRALKGFMERVGRSDEFTLLIEEV